MLYSLSEFLTMVKEDIGIKDIAMPISDQQMIKRIDNSALKIFSQIYPRIEMGRIGEENRIGREAADRNILLIYRIPRHLYLGTELMGITRVDVVRPMGFSDYYVPNGMFLNPISALESLADVKMSAALAQSMSKAPTGRFVSPDLVYLYNGWAGGSYVVDMWLKHDISLSTIPDTAMMDFQRLVELDLMQYLFTELKRKDNLDLLVGNSQLKIENWEQAEGDKRSLIEEWRNTSGLDIDNMSYF